MELNTIEMDGYDSTGKKVAKEAIGITDKIEGNSNPEKLLITAKAAENIKSSTIKSSGDTITIKHNNKEYDIDVNFNKAIKLGKGDNSITITPNAQTRTFTIGTSFPNLVNVTKGDNSISVTRNNATRTFTIGTSFTHLINVTSSDNSIFVTRNNATRTFDLKVNQDMRTSFPIGTIVYAQRTGDGAQHTFGNCVRCDGITLSKTGVFKKLYDWARVYGLWCSNNDHAAYPGRFVDYNATHFKIPALNVISNGGYLTSTLDPIDTVRQGVQKHGGHLLNSVLPEHDHHPTGGRAPGNGGKIVATSDGGSTQSFAISGHGSGIDDKDANGSIEDCAHVDNNRNELSSVAHLAFIVYK